MNNRIIKFRAYDIKNKQWLNQVPSLEYLLDDPDGAVSHHDIDEESAVFFCPRNPLGSTFNNRIIYQQFTGLLDKNGKEIYEGDIIKGFASCHFDKEDIIIAKVIWQDDWGWWGFEQGNGKEEFLWYEIKNDAEIIGNVFENSDLLK